MCQYFEKMLKVEISMITGCKEVKESVNADFCELK